MANRIQIRAGAAVPTTSNLLYRELGYSTSSKQLYINDNGTIRSIGLTEHTHGTYDRASSVLSGANVFSDIVVTDGIVTSTATRALTAADISALPLSGGTMTGTITGAHIKATGTGNDYHIGGFETMGNGTTNTVFPTYGFYQPGLYAASIQLRGATDFRLYAQASTAYASLTALNVAATGSISEGGTTLSSKYLGISAKAADSNLLDGYNSASAGTADTIALRDSAGDIVCRLLRPTYTDQTDISGAIAFRTNNSTDNYLRFCSDAAAIRTFIGAAPTSHTHTAAQLPNAFTLLWSGTISVAAATATLNSAYSNFDFLIVVIALDNASSENHVPVTIPVGTISTNARRFSSGVYMSGTTYMYLNFSFPSTTSIKIDNFGGALTKAIKYVYGVKIA